MSVSLTGGEPETRTLDTRAGDAGVGISQRVNTRAAASYHVLYSVRACTDSSELDSRVAFTGDSV